MNDNDGMQNLKIVKAMTENGILGRWDIVQPLVADDVVIHAPEGIPYGGVYRGWQGYLNIFAAMGKFWSDLKVGPSEFTTYSNKVAVISQLNGRIARTGKEVSMPLAEVWEIKGGKVAAITAFYFDTKLITDLA
jgi:ketosteroid isomerase-like protein